MNAITLPQTGPYFAAFQILCQDFRRLAEYVEPVDANLTCYSHRIYELLLRACTEFESACKEALGVLGSSKPPDRMNITDYRQLENTLRLAPNEVGILIWQPEPCYVTPFAGWASTSPLWYGAYNDVKHNRNTAFARASLDNLRQAMAGLFALLVGVEVIDQRTQMGITERPAKRGQGRELIYTHQFFTIVPS